jgi:Mg-chelatase subunit ChlD
VTFANPAGLWLLGLAVPILVLHILRPRRDEVDVPSVYLWRDIAVPVSAARPWQRLRPSLLLLAQLLVVVGLALAVARPVQLTETPLAEHTVFIVDASGSMAARDGSPDRLGDAVAEAKRLRDEIPAGGMASVVVADTRPRVLLSASTDRGVFHQALDTIETTPGAADFASAFVLAEAQETREGDIAFVLVSDGGLTDDEQRLIPPGTTYRAVGQRTTNRAITRLTVEPRSAGLLAVVAVANTGSEHATQTLRLDVDGRTTVEEEVELTAGEAREETFELPAGERVEAFLEGEDLLDADDHVYAAAPPRRALDVVVLGPDDPALRALLDALASVERVDYTWTAASDPADQAAVEADDADDADLVIYNQVPVPAAPPAPFWAIAPPAGAPGVAVTGTVEQPVPTLVRADDALLIEADLSEVLFGAAQALESPTAEILVGSERTPLILRARTGQVPFVYMGFPLSEQSTLPLNDAFPMLGDRILAELAGSAQPPGSLDVGEALPVDATRPTTVTGPGGLQLDVAAGQPAPHADRVGFWTVQPEGQPARAVAVNPSSRESDLDPARTVLAPERTSRPGESPPRGEVSVLAWVVGPLLGLLLVEWWLARRRSGVSRRQFRLAALLRLLVALALIAALLDLALISKADDVATVFVVDASDSLGAAGQDAALEWVRDAVEEMPDGHRAGVALFGGATRLELTVQSDPVLGQAAVQVDPSRTNLAGALRMAGSVLPSDAKRRIVLVSDGRPTEGDVLEETERLSEAGIPVDVHLVERSGGPDSAVLDVDVPNRARLGEQVPVRVEVHADQAGPAVVALLADGRVIQEQTVELNPGTNQVEFSVAADQEGLSRFQARVSSATDTVAQNDVGYGAVQVEGAPTVLVLEGRSGAGATLAEALRSGGMTVETRAATAVPSYDELLTYASVVLVDVPEAALTLDQVAGLSAATRDLGRGLVTIGGTQSYGLGGYLDSELEQLLPVVSDILDPQRRQSVSEVLAIDTSGSMGACHCSEGGDPSGRTAGGVRKTDIARAGAARAIEALAGNDEIGILAVDTEDDWVLDLQQLPAEEVVTSGLRHISPSGESTDLSTALSTAAQALRESRTSLKHIILFTDGFVNDEGVFGDLETEAAALREEGITVSVLATGEGAAGELEAIADAGGGRFYPGRDLQEIPQLIQQEVTMASRDFVNEGEFLPTVTSNAATVRDLQATPPLLGYVATTAKPQTETQLQIGPDQDPLLASWNVGLGRVTSWTSDGGDRWAQTWAGWDGHVDFWSSVVADTFPRTEGGTVTARIEDGRLRVRIEGESDFGEGSEARARVVGPDLEPHELRLERLGGNVFAGELPVTEAGSYGVAAQVTGPGEAGAAAGGDVMANLSYSAEYAPGAPDPGLLLRVSELTGGRGEIEPGQAFDPEGLRSGRQRVPLARWLLVAAALLWPLAVALSRLVLRGTVTAQLRHGGAIAAWWLRAHLPSRPVGQTPADRRERPSRPSRPSRPPESAPTGADRAKQRQAAPAASLGTLLESQRRRRQGPDDDAP